MLNVRARVSVWLGGLSGFRGRSCVSDGVGMGVSLAPAGSLAAWTWCERTRARASIVMYGCERGCEEGGCGVRVPGVNQIEHA